MFHIANIADQRREERRNRDLPLIAALKVAVANLEMCAKADPLGWNESEELLDFLRASDALTQTDANVEMINELEGELEGRGEEEVRLIDLGYTEYSARRAAGLA